MGDLWIFLISQVPFARNKQGSREITMPFASKHKVDSASTEQLFLDNIKGYDQLFYLIESMDYTEMQSTFIQQSDFKEKSKYH